MIRWLLAGMAVLSVQTAIAAEQPERLVQWKKSQGGNDHWYQAVFVPERINWVEAHLRATNRGCGWHLATITSWPENRFVYGLIANRNKFFIDEAGPWLGGFQRRATNEPAGQWRWVTEENFRFTNWNRTLLDNKCGGRCPGVLAPGVPLNAPEDFLEYLRGGSWNDLSANALMRGYIIETEHPRPESCSGG